MDLDNFPGQLVPAYHKMGQIGSRLFTTTGGDPAGGGGGGAPEPVKITLEDGTVIDDAVAYFKRLRGENADLRTKHTEVSTKLKTYTDKEAEIERQKLEEKGEYEKLLQQKDVEHKKELEKRENIIKEFTRKEIRDNVNATAKELGVRPDALEKIPKLINMQKVVKDDEGNIVGAKEQIEALLEEMPFLKAEAGDGGQQTGDGGQQTGGQGAGQGGGRGVGADGRPGSQPGRGTGEGGKFDAMQDKDKGRQTWASFGTT